MQKFGKEELIKLILDYAVLKKRENERKSKKSEYNKPIDEYKKAPLEKLKETYSKRELNFDVT